jgi:predicted RNase H-like HicB family nuclease
VAAVDGTPDSCQFAPVKSTYTAITQQDGDWWVGWIEEIPGVNAQERTKEELMSSLREILLEAIEFNRAEARASAKGDYTEEPVSV